MRARRLSVRGLWGLASWALPLALVFLVTPVLLRALGSERFGVLMIVFVTPLLASQLDFGIAASSVRRLAAILTAGKIDAGRTLATFAIALGAIGSVLGLIVWIIAPALSQVLGFEQVLGYSEGESLIRWCAVWVAVTLFTPMPGVLARAAQALGWITIVQTLSAAALWLSALAVARSGRPLTDIVLVGIGTSIAASFATAIAVRQHVQWHGPIKFDAAVLGTDARFTTGLFASQMAGALVYQGDRILIAAIGSPAIAGAYALCANVANKTLAAVVALTSFAFPHAAGLSAQGDRTQLASLLHALDRGVIAIITPALLPGVLLAGPFLSLWLGNYGTPELVTVFRILWIGFAINVFSVPVSLILTAHGNAGLAARFAWLTVSVVIGSLFLLVPPWGARGAAIAMLLGMATSPVFNLVARRTLALPPAPGRRRFWLGIAVGLAAQLLLLAAWNRHVSSWLQLMLAGASGVGVFYGVRAIFKLLSPEEERLLRGFSVRRSGTDNL
jgi:O-antigen/teichoic acid export membrane protein